MNRRKFFKNGSLFTLGGALFTPSLLNANQLGFEETYKNICRKFCETAKRQTFSGDYHLSFKTIWVS